jgi:hypothetical protein
MKRLGAIISLSLLIVLLASSFSFAAGLELVSTYPEEGENGLQSVNVAVKLVFNENMTSEQAQAANESKFQITDSEGEAILYSALYNAEKYPNEIWLQITQTLKDNAEYTLNISEHLVSTAGNELGEQVTLKFSTRDTAADNTGYMVLMVLMMVAMIGFTVWETGSQVKKQQAGQRPEDQKVNPYKESKRTGKSVEEIVAKTEKEKTEAEKRFEKEERKHNAKGQPVEVTEIEDGVKRVSGRRPISAAGIATPNSVIAKRKAREAAAAKEQARIESRNQKSGAQKPKGSKQQQKKKK